MIGRITEKLNQAEAQLTKNAVSYIIHDYRETTLRPLQASVNSYLGHFRHARAIHLTNTLINRSIFLKRYFRLHGFRLKSRWRWRSFSNLRVQWYFLRGRFQSMILLIQIGRFLECFNEYAEILIKTLRLKPISARRGFNRRCGWLWQRRHKLTQRIQARGLSYVLIEETPRQAGRVRERRPVMVSWNVNNREFDILPVL